jgi:hypothetical protein
MKKCPGCRKQKPKAAFSRKRKGLQARCKECRSKYAKQHYAKNKKVYLKRAEAQRRAAWDVVRRLKSQPCKDCGKRYPTYVMDFDHVRGKKKYNIGGLNKITSIPMLLREVEKCDVVCSNCHRERTHKRYTAG